MNTSIGQNLRETPRSLAVMAVLGVLVCASDLGMHLWFRRGLDHCNAAVIQYERVCRRVQDGEGSYEDVYLSGTRAVVLTDAVRSMCVQLNYVRALLLVVVMVGFRVLAKDNTPALGLLGRPTQGWRWWIMMGVVLAVVSSLVAAAAATVWMAFGWRMQGIFNLDEDPAELLLWSPIFEEVIYRVGLCIPAAALWGPRWAIVVSAVPFALLHVVYGNANPINTLAGILLAWTFLKSNTILVPLTLHISGNLLAIFASRLPSTL